MVADTELPAVYQAADAASLAGQRRFVATLRYRVVGYVVAAVGGAFVWSVGRIDILGVLALVGLLAAVGAEIYTIREKPDRTWYEGRAAAESAKTLSWRYMVGGAPFGLTDVSLQDADKEFANELRAIFRVLTDLDAPPAITSEHQITQTMRAHRASSLDERRKLYDEERIEDQRRWYSHKAKWNSGRARGYELVSLILQLGGVFAAGLKAFTIVSIDLLGIVGALGGALLTWSQARQHRSLASAYQIAAQELAAIRSLMSQERTEEEWAQFVNESEEAISREHTLWRASRGVA